MKTGKMSARKQTVLTRDPSSGEAVGHEGSDPLMREKGLGKQVFFSKGAAGEHVCWPSLGTEWGFGRPQAGGPGRRGVGLRAPPT